MKLTAMASAACGLSSCGTTGSITAPITKAGKVFAQSPILRKFISPLPALGTGIPIASADTSTVPGVDLYNLSAVQYHQLMHPDLPNPTTLWGYMDQSTGKSAYLGPIIVAQRGRPSMIRATNMLPSKHPLPVDTTLMGADNGAAQNRMTIHLHGGLTPWTSDGGPFSWFTPTATGPSAGAGECFLNGISGTPGAAQYYYPNNVSARLMWYHDHALGLTRLNAYAGLASGYLMNDDVVTALTTAGIIPAIAYTVPLIIQDKSFKAVSDQYGQPGDLWYPTVYEGNSSGDETGRWDLGTPSDGFPNLGPPVTPSCVPEFFADTPVINGEAYPYLQAQPRRYRVVILNGSQARFYNLNLFYENKFQPGEPDFTRGGPAFIQIGNEGGVLPAPVVYNMPPVLIPTAADDSCDPNGPHSLLMAPAERADLIIDFSSCQPGDRLILYNDAPAPFPGGDTRNDYFTGNPDLTAIGGAPSTVAGKGPNTRTLMQIQVIALTGAADTLNFASTLNVLQSANGLPKAYHDSHIPFGEVDLDPNAANVLYETKTLNEDFDSNGRLIQRVGTGSVLYTGSFGRNYIDAPTEVYPNNQVVVWDIYNTTGDTHPMHFHLTNVQVLGSAPYVNVGTPAGPFVPPDRNYAGWKETVRMNPGYVTRVIMKFSLPTGLPFAVPGSPRAGLLGGHEYVWHCHILEHEEHDMMRPLVIMP